MNTLNLEILSEFIDAADNSTDHNAIVAHIVAEPKLQQKWQRYHLIGDVIRHRATAYSGIDFADKVFTQLEQQETINTTVISTSIHNSRNPLISWAIAASLVSFTIIGVWLFNQTTATQNYTISSIDSSIKPQLLAEKPFRQLTDIDYYLAKHGAMASSNQPMNIHFTNYNQ